MVRYLLAIATAWTLLGSAVLGQTATDQIDKARQDAAQAQREVEQLQQQADAQVYSYRKAQEEVKSAAVRFNGQVRVLRNEGQFLDLQTQIANNVISLRKKDEFDKWLDKTRQQWSMTDEVGYRRIREVNGLDRSTYQRFYDNQGNLMVIAFRDYYDRLQRSREEWTKARQRAVDTKDQVERQYQDAVKQYGTVKASLSDLAGKRAEAQRRLEQFQSLDRQRVMEEERRRQQEEAERLRSQPRRPRDFID